jgi:quinoprotein glucose dehydrogenase
VKIFLAVILVLLGLVVGFGGVWLLALGGSPYYVVAAAGLLVAGLLLLLGRPTGLLVYALVIAGSLGWAIYEVGFDWWQLAPRGGLLIVLGLLLLTPWVRRPLARRSGKVWGR